jgi:cell division protein FtsW
VRRAAAILFLLAIVLLIIVLFTGAEVKGAQRWIKLGGFSLQPVEMLKPSIVILAAALFARPPAAQGRENAHFIAAAAAGSLFAVAGVLLLAQPDVGQTAVLFLIYLALFLLAGMPLIWLAGLGAVAALGGALAYVLFPHVHTRVDSFLNPAPGEGYQIQKALQAIGHGGILGRGPGEGAVKMSLPDAHTDFAFSVAAEEFGFVALLGLILLFAALSMRGLSMARRLNDPFAQLAASGLYCLLALEAGLNIAVNLAMVPPKGLALPFISYGGSSMLGVTLTVGLALALTRRRPGAYERAYAPRKTVVRASA